MIPNTFDYHAPTTLEEALDLLKTHGDSASVLAGGHSLVPLMKLRFAAPDVVIDLGRIPGLSEIGVANGQISIGALATHYAIQSNAQLASTCPLLPETAAAIGDAQVRNKGTLGGSLVHADPAADWPATMLALNAEFDMAGPNGTRTVAATDFFLDLMTTALEPGEVLTCIKMPTPVQHSGGAYAKMRQSASGFAIAGVAAHVSLNAGNTLNTVAVAITGVSLVPYRATAVEEALKGQSPDAIADATQKATDGVTEFQEDPHASADYRAHLAKVFARRTLQRAIERAQS